VRLALISDQHGNDVAFRVALEDVERLGVEEILCLGDVVQGGTEPATVESLGNRLAGLPGVEGVAWARRALLSGSLGGAVVGVEIAGQPKMEFHFNQV